MDHIIIEELTLTPIGESQPLNIRPIRVTVNGKVAPLIFDARGIAEAKEYAAVNQVPGQKSDDGHAV